MARRMHCAGPMDVVVVMNTASGTLSVPEQRDALLVLLRDADLNATVLNVATGGEIAAVLRPHLERGCRTVVAAGGDGTVSTVAAMLAGTETSLGVIPGGTLNHFVKDLKIPLDLAGAVNVIKTGVTKRVDVGTVNGRSFLNNSGLGLYPEMLLTREQIRRRRGFRKLTALLIAGVLTLLRFPLIRVRLEVKGQTVNRRTPFVFVGNNPYEVEGVHFGSRPRIDTGQLCVWVARGPHRFSLLRALIQMAIKGLRGVREMDVLYAGDATIKTRRRTVPVSLDGEVFRLQMPLQYAIRPGALAVIVPAGEPQ